MMQLKKKTLDPKSDLHEERSKEVLRESFSWSGFSWTRCPAPTDSNISASDTRGRESAWQRSISHKLRLWTFSCSYLYVRCSEEFAVALSVSTGFSELSVPPTSPSVAEEDSDRLSVSAPELRSRCWYRKAWKKCQLFLNFVPHFKLFWGLARTCDTFSLTLFSESSIQTASESFWGSRNLPQLVTSPRTRSTIFRRSRFDCARAYALLYRLMIFRKRWLPLCFKTPLPLPWRISSSV